MSIQIYSQDQQSGLFLSFIGNQISAGFPSPAEDYLESMLDLNRELIRDPSSTFYGRIKGFSVKEAGVDDGDLLVIDKSLKAKFGDLVVCYLNEEFILKRMPIPVSYGENIMIWGIVTYIIRRVY